MRKRYGQSLAEYVIVAGLIAVALATMGPAFRRSVQKVFKGVADVMGFQHDAEQAAEPDKGFVNYQISNAETTASTAEHRVSNAYKKEEQEWTDVKSVTYTNGALVNE